MRRADKMLAGLVSSRRRLLAEVEGLLEPRFSARPARGGWSAAQVLEHLSRVDDNLARGIAAVVAGKAQIRPQWNDPLRRLLYTLGIYRLVRIRTVPPLDPSDVPARPEALTRSAAARSALLAAIESNEGPALWKHSFRHPIFGPLSMEEMLGFVSDHEERHRLQIVRIKAALDREQPEKR
jgi:uncharacterized damage-inducible protein DinB